MAWAPDPDALRGKVAVVAGATRGAGRGIAAALGEAGATVVCTGRSTGTKRYEYDRPETIEETAALVTSLGGTGIAEVVDHLVPEQVGALAARIRADHGHVDVLVNDIWGGEQLKEWETPIWEHDLDNGLRIVRLAIETHLITSHFLLPLLIDRPGGLLVEVTDGTRAYNDTHYRLCVYYDLAKVAVNRLAYSQGHELAERGATAVALTPGWLRSEMMLENFGVAEENWRDVYERRDADGNPPARPTSRSRRPRASSAARSSRWPRIPTGRGGTSSRSTRAPWPRNTGSRTSTGRVRTSGGSSPRCGRPGSTPTRPTSGSAPLDTVAGMTAPEAVLLDVGGVFLLPEHDRILAALQRAECAVEADVLDGAHYRGAARFGVHLDVEADWAGCWRAYLDDFLTECGVPDDYREEAHRHVDSEFADAALWLRVIPGCREGLQELADTGVRLGIVSNADGLIGERLRTLEILQVGPGIGIEVECVIDSGEVGIMKPDPRIFAIALEAMGVAADRAWYVGDMPAIDVVGARQAGLHAVVMDPLGLHHDADYDRVDSLADLASRVAAT